jgi:hypothetical protein
MAVTLGLLQGAGKPKLSKNPKSQAKPRLCQANLKPNSKLPRYYPATTPYYPATTPQTAARERTLSLWRPRRGWGAFGSAPRPFVSTSFRPFAAQLRHTAAPPTLLSVQLGARGRKAVLGRARAAATGVRGDSPSPKAYAELQRPRNGAGKGRRERGLCGAAAEAAKIADSGAKGASGAAPAVRLVGATPTTCA